MKIGIIIKHCRTFRSSRYVLEISKYFSKNNEVHIFTNNWDQINNDKIFFHKIPMLKQDFHLEEASFNFFATLSLWHHNVDVTLAQPTRYFSPDVAEMQFVYGAWSKYKKKNNFSITLQDKIGPLIERYNLKKSKLIIAISNIVKKEVMENHGIRGDKIRVVHSGVNLDDFHPRNKKYSEEIRKRHGIREDDLVLLFVGNPFQRKGLKYVIEALPKLKSDDVKFLVLGRDDPKSYQKLASKLKVGDKFIFGGFSREVIKYFGTADVFVFPTLYEPFGLVIVEAMACGLPVVTSKIAGGAELIQDGKDGFWLDDPKNPNEIADKLNRLVEDDRFRKRMSKEARKKAEKFSWETTANKMLKVFEEVI